MFFNWYEPKECRHKFEGRWDEMPLSVNLHGFKGNVAAVVKAFTDRIYVRDICVKCGKTIEREK